MSEPTPPLNHQDFAQLSAAIDRLSRVVEPLTRLIPQIESVIRLVNGEDEHDDRGLRTRVKEAEKMLARHEQLIGPIIYLGGPLVLAVIGLVANAIWRAFGGP